MFVSVCVGVEAKERRSRGENEAARFAAPRCGAGDVETQTTATASEGKDKGKGTPAPPFFDPLFPLYNHRANSGAALTTPSPAHAAHMILPALAA